MRITRFSIANFGSLSKVEFSDLGERVVLVGANGTGKTFVFQAIQLFFGEFAWIGGASTLQNADYLWQGGEPPSRLLST